MNLKGKHHMKANFMKIALQTVFELKYNLQFLGKYAVVLTILLNVFCHVQSSKSTENGPWTLNNSLVIFGETVALKSTFDINICSNDSSRHWSKGKSHMFLITNGNSANESKYREVLSQDCFTSYLIIDNFNQNDIGVEYTFAYSTSEFSNELTLNRNKYISYPSSSSITSEIHCKNGNVSLLFELMDINPVPKCFMAIMNDTLSFGGKAKNISEFLSSSKYLFQYQLMNNYKKEKIYVWCDFHTINITVYDDLFICDEPKDLEQENNFTVILIATSLTAVVLVILLFQLRKYRLRMKKKEYDALPTTSQSDNNKNEQTLEIKTESQYGS